MINYSSVLKFCREDMALIENFKKAALDTKQMWVCHHRDEVKILPSGIKVNRSVDELKENDRYYNCPANELIFLTRDEHARIHMQGIKRNFSDAHRKHIGDAMRGRKIHSKESKAKIGKKATERQIGCHWYNNGKTRCFCKVCLEGFIPGYKLEVYNATV